MPPIKKSQTIKTKAKPRFVQERKDLILRLLKDQEINWIIEGGIVKRLFNKYPYPEFWNQFNIPHFFTSFTSFRVFTTGWGAEYVNKNFNLWLNHQKALKQNVNIETEKLGEDVIIKTKPKTVKDFLK